VALLAVRPEPATVRVAPAVASDAGHWSFAERDLRSVTAVATHGRMRAFEMKLRE